MTLTDPLKVVPGPCGYWIMNRRPDSPETGHFLRARTRAPAMGSKCGRRRVHPALDSADFFMKAS